MPLKQQIHVLPQIENFGASGGFKDTVTTDEEDDKVNTDDHPGKHGAAVCHDAVIHDHVPVLTCQNLNTQSS